MSFGRFYPTCRISAAWRAKAISLRNQDYALLIGSLGLFLALAATMYLTRRLDWRGLKYKA